MSKLKISEALTKGIEIAKNHNISVKTDQGHWFTRNDEGCFACAIGTIALGCGLSPKMAEGI